MIRWSYGVENSVERHSAKGELPVIDGGLREFAANPATAWEPVKGSVVGEYRSVKPYPKADGIVLGHFFFFGRRIYDTNPEHLANRVEVGGLFWHFVDLVWIFLFPVFYLL